MRIERLIAALSLAVLVWTSGCSGGTSIDGGDRDALADCPSVHGESLRTTVVVNPNVHGALLSGLSPQNPLTGKQLYATLYERSCTGESIPRRSFREQRNSRMLELESLPTADPRLSEEFLRSIAVELDAATMRQGSLDSVRAERNTLRLYSMDNPLAVRRELSDPARSFERGFSQLRSHSLSQNPAGGYTLKNSGGGKASITVLPSTADPRDVLSADTALVITSDRNVLAYSRSHSGHLQILLGPAAAYVFISPLRDGSVRADSVQLDAFRSELSASAVRASVSPYPTQDRQSIGSACVFRSSAKRSPSSRTTRPRIVYDAADATARDIAERIVGLSSAESPIAGVLLGQPNDVSTVVVSSGVTADALIELLKNGSDVGYVLRLDGSPVAKCDQLASYAEASDWLADGLSTSAMFVVPLVVENQFLVGPRRLFPNLKQDAFGRVGLMETNEVRQ